MAKQFTIQDPARPGQTLQTYARLARLEIGVTGNSARFFFDGYVSEAAADAARSNPQVMTVWEGVASISGAAFDAAMNTVPATPKSAKELVGAAAYAAAAAQGIWPDDAIDV